MAGSPQDHARVRLLAGTLGFLILAWQLGNAWRGRFLHDFLVPDLVVAGILIWGAMLESSRTSRRLLLVGLGGSTLVLTWAAILGLASRRFDPGKVAAGLGAVVSAWGTFAAAKSAREAR